MWVLIDAWISRCEDMQTRGHADARTCRCDDVKMWRLIDQGTYRCGDFYVWRLIDKATFKITVVEGKAFCFVLYTVHPIISYKFIE